MKTDRLRFVSVVLTLAARVKSRGRFRCLFLFSFLGALLVACTPDPSETGLVAVAVETTPFPGLEGVRVISERVDVVLRTDQFDENTEEVVTLGEETQELGFAAGLGGQVPELQTMLQVPEGFIAQLRFVNSRVFARLESVLGEVEIMAPSGPQTGLKVFPADGVAFPVRKDAVTIINLLFEPDQQLVFNPPKILLKPTIPAELIAQEDLRVTRFIDEEAVVLFEPGTTQAEIDTLNANLGATVVSTSSLIEGLMTVRVPGTAAADIVDDYRAEAFVRAAIINAVASPDATFPDDLNDHQDNLHNTGQRGGTVDADIDAPEAWDISVGATTTLIAGLDSGVDVNHPDIVENLWINQGELPVAFFDVAPVGSPDGVVDPDDIDALDTDGDGRVSFRDLNSPSFALNASGMCLGGPPPLDCDRDGDGIVTPLDLVDGDPGTLVGFEDGVDDDDFDGDPNTFIDDLVGWDFANGDNLPDDDGVTSHGTGTAGIIAAAGNNGASPLAPIAIEKRMTGVVWRAALIPIKVTNAAGSARAQDLYDALALAVQYGAPVASMSITFKLFEDTADLTMELSNHTAMYNAANADQLLLVNSTGNGAFDLDDPNTLLVPAEIANDSIVTVGSTDFKDRLVKSSGFGATTVDLVAPGSNILTLNNAAISITAFRSGTSFATPTVAGVAALMYSVDPGLTPSEARQTLIDTVDDLGLGARTVSGGRVNANAALSAL